MGAWLKKQKVGTGALRTQDTSQGRDQGQGGVRKKVMAASSNVPA